MKCMLVLIALAVVVLQCEGKTFTRCELVRELRRQRFPERQLRDWVCLVERESNRRTNAIRNESNGSRSYGLFQINDRFWCSNTNTPGKDCNVRCSDLITPEITRASNCAKTIYNRQGFNAWNGWKSHCQGSLPDISSC
ncbi:lysozyme-like [Maniola hyperantus]|uniref:lysozyme-like n=1 Tax=Aphantopus hyperantus TaxID=2795564 RepID=UPI001568F195|nr:lysozyme-like [Maniola hyperantus]